MTGLRGEVRLALSNFPGDPQIQGRKLRQLADASWDEFVQEADLVLTGGEDSTTARFLMAIYASRGRLIPFLARLIQTHRENGRRAARLASRLDPELDRRLAEAILNAQHADNGGVTQPALLEVLAETERSEVLLPVLGSLRESEDPRVRSKLALLVGRAARAQAWVRILRQDPDPRVRANAIESLWDVGSAFAAVCFDLGLKDAHQRVAANSAVGLHRMGDARSVARLAEMAESPEIEQRLSAIWAMGVTRDTRFVPLLWKFRRGADEALAAGAAAACERILLAQAEANRAEAVMLPLGAQRLDDGRIVAKAAVLDHSRTPVQLQEIHWRPKLGNQPVWRYAVRPVEGLPRIAVAVLLPLPPGQREPRAGVIPAALRECLRAKRAGDSIAVTYYGEPPAAETPGQERSSDQPRAVLLTTDVRMAVHTSAPSTTSAPIPLHEAAEACLGTLRQFRGGRHLLIVLDRPPLEGCRSGTLREIAAKAAQAGVACHVVCSPGLDASMFEESQTLTKATEGFHLIMEGPDSLQVTLALLMPAFIRHYEITISPAESSDQLDIEVVSEQIAGRARWNLQPGPSVSAGSPDIHWEGENALPLESAGLDGRDAASGDCAGGV